MNVRRIILFTVVLPVIMQSVAFSQDLLWSSVIGGEYNENGYAGLQTDDGNFVIFGNTFSYGTGSHDFYFIQVDNMGDTIRTRTYGGIETEYGYDICRTYDDGFILAGSTKSYGSGKNDIYIIKTDSTGTLLWSKTIGGTENDIARSVRETADSGLIICGTTSSFGAGYDDVYFIRTDSTGDTLWTTTIGGAGGETGWAVRETHDNGFIAVGATGSFGDGYSAMYAIRLDSDGDSLWATTYGGTSADYGYSVETTIDKGFLFAGGTASSGEGYTDAWLVKTDSLGVIAWENTYGGAYDDRGYSVTATLDGGYLLTGTTESFGSGKNDIFIVKTNPVGDTLWTAQYGGSDSDYGRKVFQESGTNYIVIGYSYSGSAGGTDMYIGKISRESTPFHENPMELLPSAFELEQNYPNPFNHITTIDYSLARKSPVTLTIYNILGRMVREWHMESVRAGIHSFQWDGLDNSGRAVTSGVYFYRMSAAQTTKTKKLVFLK